jgi:hypothetical protein
LHLALIEEPFRLSSFTSMASSNAAASASVVDVTILLIVSGDEGRRLPFMWPPSACSGSTVCGINKEALLRLLAPRSSLCGKLFDLQLDDLCILGVPMHLAAKSSSDASRAPLSLFHVVVAVKKVVGMNAQLLAVKYSALVHGIASALLSEELRMSFVSSQVDILNACCDDTGRILYDKCCAMSALARELCSVQSALSKDGSVTCTINGWIRLSLPSPSLPSSPAAAFKSLAPYHSLLLMKSRALTLAELPCGSNPDLRAVMKACDPLKPLHQVGVELGIPLPRLFTICNHCVQWGLARIVDTITRHSMFALTPGTDLSMGGVITTSFGLAFPQTRPLYRWCATLASGSAFGTVRDMSLKGSSESDASKRWGEMKRVTIWLLQHNVISPLR